jgi:hypothetical protein
MKMFTIQDKAKPDIQKKYKRLKLGGGQAYDRSSDQAAVLAKHKKHDLLSKGWTDRGLVYSGKGRILTPVVTCLLSQGRVVDVRRLFLTPTCRVSGYPRQVIKVDASLPTTLYLTQR